MKLFEFFNVPVDNKDKPMKIGKSKDDKLKLADEIFWFIIDNDALHKEFVLPFAAELKDKISSPEFNKERFHKMWGPMVAKGCKLYHKKEKLKDSPDSLFDDEFKKDICQKVSDKFQDEFKNKYYQVGDHTL
jgi:hypothetical protein